MTDKELRRIGRAELLELLLAQSEENERLQQRVEELEEELRNREIMIDNAGTIADAAFQLNGVLDAAGNAAVQYIENIKRLNRLLELKAQEMGISKDDILVSEGSPQPEDKRRKPDPAHSVRFSRAADNLVRGYSLNDLERMLEQEKSKELNLK